MLSHLLIPRNGQWIHAFDDNGLSLPRMGIASIAGARLPTQVKANAIKASVPISRELQKVLLRWALALTIDRYTTLEKTNENMTEIVSVEWLNQNLKNKNLIILDATLKFTADGQTLDFYQESIPYSRYIDIRHSFTDRNSRFPNTLPNAEQFELECRKLGINKKSKIVVFDNLGIYSSPRVWWMFKTMGHNDISVLNGGLPEWKRKGFSTVERKSYNYELGDFQSYFQNQFVVIYKNILLNTVNKSFSIIDARSKGRFNGTEKEPRKFLKSGHIPNSINIPYNDVLENGKFKSELELKNIFQKECFNTNNLVFSCGSGLTACIVMMASEIVYKKSKKIYDGSWTEWAELQNLKENVV